ncbi:MFS transporter [Escherichia coli]
MAGLWFYCRVCAGCWGSGVNFDHRRRSELPRLGLRIPFFIALPLGIIGLYLRHALEETPAFQQHVDKLEQGDREGLQGWPYFFV